MNDMNYQQKDASDDHSYDENDNDIDMNSDTKNIFSNCQEIMSNIELDIPIRMIDHLYQEAIYIEMFKKMFPFMKDKIQAIEESQTSTGEKLQHLINGLSTDVLTMDLTHIKGQAIADKDPRHLINFLQIILELSKLYLLKKDPEQNNDGNYNYEGQDHEEGLYTDEENQQENEDPNYQENPNMVDNYNNQNGQPRLTKKKSQQNLIQDEKKKIEQNIYSHQNQRVITNAPNIKQQMVPNQYQGHQEQEAEEVYIEGALSEEQKQDTEKIQELFNLFKMGAIGGDDDQKMQELHYLLGKHGLTLEEILKHEEQNGNQEVFQIQLIVDKYPQQFQIQYGDNMDENNTLAQVINISRNKLGKMRNPINHQVAPTDYKIRQGQIKYQTYLKDYKREYEKKMKKKMSQTNYEDRRENQQRRASEHEDRMLQREYKDEQQSLYYQMRDKKVQYLRNIHKIIFELEKKKVIDEQNEYKENKTKLEDEAQNKLISIENRYKNRILMLKQNLDQQRRERHVAEVAQRQELSRQERELKQIKRKQIEDLKDQWRNEREKFDLITKDDRKLENEILELYKKY